MEEDCTHPRPGKNLPSSPAPQVSAKSWKVFLHSTNHPINQLTASDSFNHPTNRAFKTPGFKLFLIDPGIWNSKSGISFFFQS